MNLPSADGGTFGRAGEVNRETFIVSRGCVQADDGWTARRVATGERGAAAEAHVRSSCNATYECA